jgi:hypothetical protein
MLKKAEELQNNSKKNTLPRMHVRKEHPRDEISEDSGVSSMEI